MLKSLSEHLPRVLRDFLRLLLWAAPLCGLFTLLNPALIIYQQDMYPLSAFFWIKLAGIGAGAALSLAAALTPIQCLLRHLKFCKGEPIIPRMLGAIFVTLFCITVFYPQASALQDGSIAAEPAWGQVMPLYAGYGVLLLAMLIFALRRNALFHRLALMAVIFSLGVTGYVAGMTIHQHSNITYLSDKTDLSFGSERNIVVIVADMLQGSFVEQALVRSPELQKRFPGFTAYTRAISPFPFTNFGLPAILSGKNYAVEALPVTYQENLNAAKADSFVTDAIRQGYQATVLGNHFILFDDAQIVSGYRSQGISNFVFSLQRLGLLRIFKKSILAVDDSCTLADLKEAKIEGINLLHRLSSEYTGNAKKKITITHVLSPHNPVVSFRRDDNGHVVVSAADDNSPDAVLDEVVFILDVLGDVVAQLQANRIYENALFIIVGDHGHFAGKNKKMAAIPGGVDFDGWEKGYWGRTASMYNPALLVKLPKATQHPMSISHAAISSLDVRGIVSNILQEQYSLDNIVSNSSRYEIALFPDKTKFNPYQTSKAHVLRKVDGNANHLVEVMRNTEFAEIEYTPLVPGKITSIVDVNTYKGFAVEPPSGAWIHGDEGAIALDMSAIPLGRSATLEFTIIPLVNAKHPVQRVLVEASNVELPLLEFRIPGDNQVVLSISSEVLQENKGKVLLRFQPLDAVTPKSIGAWDYANSEVSIFVRNITMSATF